MKKTLIFGLCGAGLLAAGVIGKCLIKKNRDIPKQENLIKELEQQNDELMDLAKQLDEQDEKINEELDRVLKKLKELGFEE